MGEIAQFHHSNFDLNVMTSIFKEAFDVVIIPSQKRSFYVAFFRHIRNIRLTSKTGTVRTLVCDKNVMKSQGINYDVVEIEMSFVT